MAGIGVVGWTFRDDYGVMMKFLIKAYRVPENKVQLFSPQQYFEQKGGGSFMMNVGVNSPFIIVGFYHSNMLALDYLSPWLI